MYTDTIIITALGVIFSIIITWIITRYYYLKNRNIRTLTPYKNFIAKVFSDIDPELKKDLKIKYKGTEVDNFYQVQFTIINTGNRSLNNFIKPLTLIIPNNGEILDVKILHIHPKGREITFNIGPGKNFISYNIPLLNSGEYFVTKLLIKGDVEPNQNFVFKVTFEDLLPDILSSEPPIEYEIKIREIIAYIIFLLVGLIIFTIGITFLEISFTFRLILIFIFLIVYGYILSAFRIFLLRAYLKRKYWWILKKFSN